MSEQPDLDAMRFVACKCGRRIYFDTPAPSPLLAVSAERLAAAPMSEHGAGNDAPHGEYVEAWIWTPKDGAYPLGPMRDGLGWVSEDNVCRGAANSDHIYFLQWKREVAR